MKSGPNSFLSPLIALALLGSAAAFSQTVVRGPYLQSATPNSVIVRWRTSIPTDSAVSYGVGTPSTTESSAASVSNHIV